MQNIFLFLMMVVVPFYETLRQPNHAIFFAWSLIGSRSFVKEKVNSLILKCARFPEMYTYYKFHQGAIVA